MSLLADEYSLWVVMPAYQEGQVISSTLAQLRSNCSNIVVVDDGSTDDTARVAEALGAEVISHPINLGQGAALQTGIAYALSRGADYICTFDADGQHDPGSIERMLMALQRNNADVALGSRFLDQDTKMSFARRMLLKTAVIFTRVQTGLPLTDTHNGLRMFTRNAASRLDLKQSGMAHGSEILAALVKLKLRVVEVPTLITYTAYSRAKGQRLSDSVKIVVDLVYAAICR